MTKPTPQNEKTLKEIAELVKGKVEGDPEKIIKGVNSLESATPDEISFFSNPRYLEKARNSKAGAILVREKTGLEGKNLVLVDDPYLAVCILLDEFYPSTRRFEGISSLAFVHPSASIGEGVSILPFSYIGKNTKIGENTFIGSHVYIGDEVEIGKECVIYPMVSIYSYCSIGDRCIIHSGVVIGSDGFGFAWDKDRYRKINHIGRVVIEEDVEIGSNTTIDRATFGETRIGKGTKIDNLVQIGHNVKIGKNCAIVAQVGISGSTEIGDNVIIGGQVGIVGHIKIEDNVKIGAKSGVHRDLRKGEIVSGIPVLPHKEWLKLNLIFQRLLMKDKW